MPKSFKSQKPALSQIAKALALVCASFPAFSIAQVTTSLGVVTVTAKTPNTFPATDTAPSQSSLDARSAQSLVSETQLRDYTSPIADYTQALNMTPGMFSSAANGVGLGDAKVTMRGVSDSNMVYSFDGIPFNDTNGVSHHSWVFFPGEFIGSIAVDRSPGRASTIGQATFAGNVDFRSRVLDADPRTSVILSAGSWNTNLIGVEHQTGLMGEDGKSNMLFAVQKMKSDGYQSFNAQDRSAAQVKYEHENSGGSTVTLFASYLNLKSNTPNIKGISRASYDAGDYTTLLSADPTKPNFVGFNFYDISTDFVYAGIAANLGDGWKVDNKAYTYRYWNKQNYNSATKIDATSAIDKLNSYTTLGDVVRFSRESDSGTLNAGLWLDQSKSYRFQIPSDPRTWVDSAVPNFSETYTTTTVQPYVEYQFKVTPDLKITPGVKYASYTQDFVHLADNGGAVGALGGAASLANSITYTDVLPSLDVHYQIQPNWSMYGQYALGDQIPSTTVFDVKDAKASPVPSPTKATTLQFGTVWSSENMTLAADIYRTSLESSYSKTGPDSAGNYSYYPSGTQTSQGVEAEANFVLGDGFSLYMNATFASLKYDATGKWVAGAPSDTQTIALNYQRANWSVGASANRIGQQYNDDSAKNNEAFVIDPYTVANLYVNYTVKTPSSFAKALKLQFGVNNVFDNHAINGIATAASGSSSLTPKSTDLLSVNAGRSVQLTATLDF